MQAQGLYWVNTDSQLTALRLCEQFLNAQQEKIISTLICVNHDDSLIAKESSLFAEDKIYYYQLPNSKNALKGLPLDLDRLTHTTNQPIILLIPAISWGILGEEYIKHWLKEVSLYCLQKNCVFFIICHGEGINRLKETLHLEHRSLYGLASLRADIEPMQYVLSWWHNQSSVDANKSFILKPADIGWEILISEQDSKYPSVQAGDDYWMFLAEHSVLEGAPPLSENWFLFDDNDQLMARALSADAATLIFSLSSNEQIETLARQIHSLRIQRGNRLKIAVREINSTLRYIDQRLLQACGANLIVPHAARLSNFLTLLEGIQQANFTRHISQDIESLLKGRNPTHYKGYLPLSTFCQVMQSIWSNTSLEAGSHGILLSLRPVSGIRPQQAISLCHLRRDGDILSYTEHHIYLFLSNCQINDLEKALNSLFSLPINEVFINRTAWTQDLDIQTEVRRLSTKQQLQFPDVENLSPSKTPDTEHQESLQLPEPITLLFKDGLLPPFSSQNEYLQQSVLQTKKEL